LHAFLDYRLDSDELQDRARQIGQQNDSRDGFLQQNPYAVARRLRRRTCQIMTELIQ